MLTFMARSAARPISGKPRGEWIWRQLRGTADPAAAAAIAGNVGFWLCHSGRRALYEALRREPAVNGRRLWIPAFICRGIVPVAQSAGYEPALYDIDNQLRPVRDTLRLRAGDAVLVAHFFGLVQPLDDLSAQLRAAGVTLIEDCAHLLKPGRDGSSTGYLGDWAIFSFRKPLPVASGGMLLGRGIDGNGVGARVSRKVTLRHWLLLAERIGPSVLGRYYCALVEWAREKLDPVRGPEAWHADDEEPISATTLRALQSLDVDAIADRRCRNYRTLALHLLAGTPGVAVPFPDLPRGSVPLVLPVQMDRPAASAAALWRAGIGAFLWPGFEVLADIDWSRYPGSRRWLESLVCLPVHQDLSAAELERIADACRRVGQEARKR